MATKILIPNIKLLVTKGNDSGKVYESNRYPIYIGRDQNNDLVLDNDNNISRRHAEINSDGSKIWLKDLNSTNGSFVNNIRITRKTELIDGSTFILGSSWIKLILKKINKKEEKEESFDDSTTFISTMKTREAILVIDLANSSSFADQYGDDAAMKITKFLNKHTVPEANKNKAKFIKSTGDGFLITFEFPKQALMTSIGILTKLKNHNNKHKEKEQVNIRIGLNYGECNIEPNGDRLGHAVNVAFRVEGLKCSDMQNDKFAVNKKCLLKSNRILVTENFYNELDDDEKLKYEYKLLGNFNLKGIKKVHKIYQMEF